MKRITKLLTLTLLLLVTLFFSKNINGACDKPFDDSWNKGIVEIIKRNADGTFISHATGFIVGTYLDSCPRIIITNQHVVSSERSDLFIRMNFADSVGSRVDTIPLFDNRMDAKLFLPSDTNLDLAAIRFCRKRDGWDILSMGRSLFKKSEQLRCGEPIYFLGFPLGITESKRSVPIYRTGVIALDRALTISSQKFDYYLIDAEVFGGSSGSPVFDCSGNFVGVLAGHLSAPNGENSGLGFMIPGDKVGNFIDEILPKLYIK